MYQYFILLKLPEVVNPSLHGILLILEHTKQDSHLSSHSLPLETLMDFPATGCGGTLHQLPVRSSVCSDLLSKLCAEHACTAAVHPRLGENIHL